MLRHRPGTRSQCSRCFLHDGVVGERVAFFVASYSRYAIVLGSRSPRCLSLSWLFLCSLLAHQYTAHAIRGEKAIIDAGAQGVAVDWFAKILIRLYGLSAQGRSRHAYLDGALEVFQDGAPPGIGLRAAPVTLIHNDDIEEVAWIVVIQPCARLVIGYRLVGSENNIAAGFCLTQDTLARIAKRRELIIHGLAEQPVAIGQVEYIANGPRSLQLPDQLKGNFRFACPCCQRQEDARLMHVAFCLQHGDDGTVDGGLLIVARFGATELVGVLERISCLSIGQAKCLCPAVPQGLAPWQCCKYGMYRGFGC